MSACGGQSVKVQEHGDTGTEDNVCPGAPGIPGIVQGWGLMGRTELERHCVPR